MTFLSSPRSWAIAGLGLVAVGVGSAVALGIRYVHESDYWLVGLPTIATALGTLALAGATFRLIQRESELFKREEDERANTLEALRHSQTIAEQSQRSATEAARQRRDSRARLLHITPFAEPVLFQPAVNEDQPVANGTTFMMPRDADVELVVWSPWKLWAADEQPIKVRLNRLEYGGEPQIAFRDIIIAPDITGRGRDGFGLRVSRTLSEWVTIAAARENGDPGPEPYGTVSVDDGYDDGVIDTYNVIQAGCPIRRDPNTNQWVVAMGMDSPGIPHVLSQVMPMQRQYFVSKTGNQRLG